ncbi:MAG: hypothetical protein JWM34_781 [Ilumatobacteraceae bacterium]|nr:hypothetical protein [Ilumatobacteraceae bacterium]
MRFLAVVLFAGCSLAASTTAEASDNDGTGVTGGVQNSAIYAGVQYGTPPSGKGKHDSNGCVWVPAAEASTFDSAIVDHRVVNGVTQNLFLRSCPHAITGVWVSQVSPANLGTITAQMVQQWLPAPTIRSAPKTSEGVVNVGMWLWTDSAQFAPVSVTAWVPTPTGIASATTTATPLRLAYSPGEPGGQLLVCHGAGEVWQTGTDDDAESSCTYAYRHSSEVSQSGTFGATMTIVWGISWRSNGGASKHLPDFETSSHADVTIREIQAVLVG